MKKLITILVLLFFTITGAMAQDILMTTRGDTLKGRLSIFKNRQGNELINIKVNKEKQQYRLIDVKRFYRKGEAYRTLFVSGRYRVVKIVNEGEFMSEYLYTPTSHTPVPDFSQGLLYKHNGEQIDIPKALLFKKTIARFLTDAPPLYEKIMNKTYGKENTVAIVRDYNAFMAGQIKAVAKQKTVESLLADLRTALQKSSKVDNKAEVTQMLNDLQSKVDAQEAVPGYLKTALTNALKEDIELSSILQEILDF